MGEFFLTYKARQSLTLDDDIIVREKWEGKGDEGEGKCDGDHGEEWKGHFCPMGISKQYIKDQKNIPMKNNKESST